MAELQAEPECRIAYFGTTVEEIRDYLAAWDPAWTETSVVAEQGTFIVGFLGAELDETLGRAWLHGPLARPGSWEDVAERLVSAVIDLIPPDISDLELAGDVANRRLAQLAADHGLSAGPVNLVLEVGREEIAAWPQDAAGVAPFDPEHGDELVALHDELFPEAYYSGPQLVDQQARGEALLLGLVEDGRLVGYAAGRVDTAGSGYLDFVGVSPASTGRGRGTRLVVEACRALVAKPGVAKVALTVQGDNRRAIALYDRLLFQTTARVVGYRRRPSSEQEGS